MMIEYNKGIQFGRGPKWVSESKNPSTELPESHFIYKRKSAEPTRSIAIAGHLSSKLIS